ncbi:S8 family serine peptidase [Bacillus pseudomycoides]|uniref:S8 family serine peptidase n=1 Tax=Bacillus TaxID=1386 RepID=UPI0018F73C11|nr:MULTISPECIES: S8 family serine peptidase [Bacillus]MBJ8031171.1 S8 family serine peptidase [Bacillus cereus group sp. N21]MCX2829650.1 S8 family serine peptidase [Bacillus sp. DHT2]MDR4919097.1 S8 family serine peptidase [Bacillus pseudomycoides]
MNFSKKLFLMFMLAFVFSSITDINSAAADSRGNSIFIILKNTNSTNTIKEAVHQEFKNVKIEQIPEIGTINLKMNNDLNTKKIIDFIKEKFPNDIEDYGTNTYVTPVSENTNNTRIHKTQEHMSLSSNALSTQEQFYQNFTWHISNVTNNYKSYDIQKGNKNILIGLIDSGVDITHPDLQRSIDVTKGKSFVTGDPTLEDKLGHGTQVAGIIAAQGNIKGIAPNTTIIPYKVFGTGDGESDWVVKAIIQAVKDDNDIINLSLGTFKSINNKSDKATIKLYKKAIQYAQKNGVLVIASAGNDSIDLSHPQKIEENGNTTSKIQIPASFTSPIIVSSTEKSGKFARYSNYGQTIDFSAPTGYFGKKFDTEQELDIQEMILVTHPVTLNNTELDQAVGIPKGYSLSLGTSLAAPQVSATAALIISRYKEIHHKKPSIQQINYFLQRGAKDLGPKGKDIYFGYGQINTYQSLVHIR